MTNNNRATRALSQETLGAENASGANVSSVRRRVKRSGLDDAPRL
jgi:hypothetical protein